MTAICKIFIFLMSSQGKFFLGTINLQDKVNSSIDILVDEEHIDGSHNMNNYNVRIR